MRSNFKKGFSLAEALVGFSLFSILMMLYLPAFYSEMARMSQLKTETEHWRIFYELVQVHYHTKSPDPLAANDHALYYENVQHFNCEATECTISFVDGSVYDVSLLEVSH